MIVKNKTNTMGIKTNAIINVLVHCIHTLTLPIVKQVRVHRLQAYLDAGLWHKKGETLVQNDVGLT